MPAVITDKGYIKREKFKLFADVSTGDASEPKWELQGNKVEDLSLELNPNVQTSTDVTGETTTTLDKYETQTSVEPYPARAESEFFPILYDIVKYEKTLSDVERPFLCVNIFAGADGSYDAWTQNAVIAVQKYGGDTSGLALPYTLHWTGSRTYGTATYDAKSKKAVFTPSI